MGTAVELEGFLSAESKQRFQPLLIAPVTTRLHGTGLQISGREGREREISEKRGAVATTGSGVRLAGCGPGAAPGQQAPLSSSIRWGS